MKKKRKGNLSEPDVYGETLNTSKKIHEETSLFLKWFTNQTYENPNLTFNKALSLFAETRPWGKKISSYASDLKAIAFAYLKIFDTPDDSLYKSELLETPEGERLRVYQEYRDKYCMPNCTDEEAVQALQALTMWNTTFGEEWEKLKQKNFTDKEFSDFYNKAEIPYKQLKKTFGTKICKAHRCMNEIPFGSNPKQEYCSEECKKREKARRYSKGHKVQKDLTTVKYYTTEGLKEAEFSPQEIAKVIKKIEKKKKGLS